MLYDLLTFHTFITPSLLLICYYMGAVVVPFLLVYYYRLLRQKYTTIQEAERSFYDWFLQRSLKSRVGSILLLVMMIVMAEIGWRMMFEMMIGYFQMHDALQQIAASVK